MSSAGDTIQSSLKLWLETNLTSFLSTLRDEFSEDPEWEMPVVEDYVLVVGVQDLKDGGHGVFAITQPGAAPYRINGLLRAATE